MPLSYNDARKLGLDDQLSNVVTGNALIKINQDGTRPSFDEAKRIGNTDLFARIISGQNPDGTDFAGIHASIGGFVSLPVSTTSTIYVATTGNDTTGDGSQNFPYRTIQKGLNEASAILNNSKVVVQVANGTYEEKLTVPVSMSGILRIEGNEANPRNVVIDANDMLDFTRGGIHHVNSGCTLEINGVMLTRSAIAVWCISTQVLFYAVVIENVLFGVIGNSNAFIDFPVSAATPTTIECNGTSGSLGISVANNTTLAIQQPISITNTAFGMSVGLSSQFYSFHAGTMSVTFNGSANFAGVSIRNNSSSFIGGAIDFDGGVVRSANRGLEVNDSYCTVLNNVQLQFANSRFGAMTNSGGRLMAGTTNWTYTNVTTPIQIDYDSIYSTNNDFNSGGLAFSGFTGQSYGYDKRYIRHTSTSYASLTTADETPTLIDTISIPNNATSYVEALVRGHRSTNIHGGAGLVSGTFRNRLGVLTLIGAVTSTFQGESGYTSTLVISGSSILVQVTGAAGHTVNWQSNTTVN